MDLNHLYHLCDQKTYDHYPENVRLSGNELIAAKRMIEVGGNKQKIKAHLTKVTAKPVLLKSLHNIQTNINKEKNVGPENELHKLHDILAQIPNAIVSFISTDDNELFGKLDRIFTVYSFLCFVAGRKLRN